MMTTMMMIPMNRNDDALAWGEGWCTMVRLGEGGWKEDKGCVHHGGGVVTDPREAIEGPPPFPIVSSSFSSPSIYPHPTCTACVLLTSGGGKKYPRPISSVEGIYFPGRRKKMGRHPIHPSRKDHRIHRETDPTNGEFEVWRVVKIEST